MTKKTPMMSNEAHFSDVFIEIDDDITPVIFAAFLKNGMKQMKDLETCGVVKNVVKFFVQNV